MHPRLPVRRLLFCLLIGGAQVRNFQPFSFREASFRICCTEFEAVTAEIVRQREILESYIEQHPQFGSSFVPVEVLPGAPEVAIRMAAAAQLVGVGPMAGVAGIMAELGARAGLDAGAAEVIVENGGDIYASLSEPATIGIYSGDANIDRKLAFSLQPGQTPIAICSLSKMIM